MSGHGFIVMAFVVIVPAIGFASVLSNTRLERFEREHFSNSTPHPLQRRYLELVVAELAEPMP